MKIYCLWLSNDTCWEGKPNQKLKDVIYDAACWLVEEDKRYMSLEQIIVLTDNEHEIVLSGLRFDVAAKKFHRLVADLEEIDNSPLYSAVSGQPMYAVL